MAKENIGTKPRGLSENLRELMIKAGITEARLARESSVPQPTINRILSKATKFPRGDTLSDLANFFGITISQLLGDDPLPTDRIPGAHNPNNRSWEILPELSWDIVTKWPNVKDELRKEGWHKWVSTDAKVSDDAYALAAKGEAMAPYFLEGTKLIIDPSCKPNDRDFVVVCPKDQNQATLKQLFYDGEEIYLKPLNPEFKTHKMTPTDKVLGVMVQARVDFRDK